MLYVRNSYLFNSFLKHTRVITYCWDWELKALGKWWCLLGFHKSFGPGRGQLVSILTSVYLCKTSMMSKLTFLHTLWIISVKTFFFFLTKTLKKIVSLRLSDKHLISCLLNPCKNCYLFFSWGLCMQTTRCSESNVSFRGAGRWPLVSAVLAISPSFQCFCQVKLTGCWPSTHGSFFLVSRLTPVQ